MIDPWRDDIGRTVVQREYVGGPFKIGVITSYNPDYVYVRYSTDAHSVSTPREELMWKEEWDHLHK